MSLTDMKDNKPKKVADLGSMSTQAHKDMWS